MKTKRDGKELAFLEVNDGSCLKNLQLVIPRDSNAWSCLSKITTGTSIRAFGDLNESQGANQKWELKVSNIEIVGTCPEEYPLQKKRHTDEFLRQIAHLRVRTNKYGAMARIRSRLTFSVHNYFQNAGFHHVSTPIITGSDCEGAGEMFQVTTLLSRIDPSKIPQNEQISPIL